MQWSRKEELRGKAGLFQEEGCAMGREKQSKRKGINRRNRVKTLAEKYSRKERSHNYKCPKSV